MTWVNYINTLKVFHYHIVDFVVNLIEEFQIVTSLCLAPSKENIWLSLLDTSWKFARQFDIVIAFYDV